LHKLGWIWHLSRSAKVLAEKFVAGEEELEVAEAIASAWGREHQRVRFAAITTDLRAARQQVAEHYREAALALGSWYSLGAEASQFEASLADRIGNGVVYARPEDRPSGSQ
jgi:hypothetical protein